MVNKITLSLIICTFQRPQQVERLLTSIKNQVVKPDEVLIVDGSNDTLTQKVAENCDTKPISLQYIKVQPDQRGLTRQRNVGIAQAKCELIAFLDDDTILASDYFAQIISCFRRHPDAIGVGGSITNSVKWVRAMREKTGRGIYRWGDWERNESIRWQARKFLGLDSTLPPGWIPPFGHGRPPIYPPDDNDYPVESVMGGASAWKREIFSQVLFSNYFYGYGLYEDLDFCIRASRVGKIYQCTKAKLEHHHAPSGRPEPFHYGKMVTRNGWFVWRRKSPGPGLKNSVKFWLITFLLAFFRLFEFRINGFFECLGRFWGVFTIMWDAPKENK